MAYSELIKSFNRIRAYMRSFYKSRGFNAARAKKRCTELLG